MTVAIFDGHYLLHRVLHVPSMRMLANKEGKPTGGTFGVIKSIRGTLREWDSIRTAVVCFDMARSARRLELYPEYKGNRKHDDEVDPDGLTYLEKFNINRRQLRFILPRIGVKVVEIAGKEGDDVIGLLARGLDFNHKLVVSDDKDMYQLVDDTIHIWRPIAEEVVSLDNYEEIVGCAPEHFLLRKAICGGKDNIKGVYGVGPKTFTKVVKEMGGDIGDHPYEKFFEYCMLHSSKKVNKIAEWQDLVLANFVLVDVAEEKFTDEEVDKVLTAVTGKIKFDIVSVKRLFSSLEFFSLIEDFSHWITRFQILQ